MNNTDIKQQAFELFSSGKSYGQIAKICGIGKTTAYDYVKVIKGGLMVETIKGVRNGSELLPNDRSGKSVNQKKLETILNKKPPVKEAIKKSKVFTGDDLVKKFFDCMEFDGKFLELIGKPEKVFSGMVWGLPKGGKSNLAIRLADYLQEYFGEVLYVAAEEGESATLQEKFKDIGGSKVTILVSKDRNEIRDYIKSHPFDFVFIDSINVANIDNDFLEIIKQANPKKSFVSVVQATKGGNFKGEQSLEHNCDFVIKVIEGVAYQKGRFAPASEINIFNEPLYKKNPNPRKAHVSTPELKPKEEIKKFPESLIALLKKENTPSVNGLGFTLTPVNNNKSELDKILSKYKSTPEKKPIPPPAQKPNETSNKGILSFLTLVGGALALNELLKPRKGENNAENNPENTK